MKTKLFVLAFLAGSILPNLLFAQFTQQGPKITGTGGNADSFQGSSVAISSDGNTAVTGGIYDNSQQGAIWIYTRSAGVWTQQGTKLVGTGGAVDFVYQGYSVAISSDGNTVIEGGWKDNNDIGAAWVFTRKDGIWTQQGAKLVGSGATGMPQYQGCSVAISSDGNTAFIGGEGDNNYTGAVWVFTRSNNIWTQQGSKLVGTGGIGQSSQGISVAVSSDGNTLIEGGSTDNGYLGASWVFTRNGEKWTQQGLKLLGSDPTDASVQGSSVSISSDGNTAIVGGPGDFMDRGAAWVYTRSNGLWSQQGPILYAEGSTSRILVGKSVAISPDGNTALVSSPGADYSTGKVWVFTRSAGKWTKQSSPFIGLGAEGAARQGWSVAISSDGTFIESGPYDTGGGAIWFFHNLTTEIDPLSDNLTPTDMLEQNFPNPFNLVTKIRFQILKSAFTRLTVSDQMGRQVSTLVNEKLSPGMHDVDFDGSKIALGTYFYKLETDGAIETMKMIIIK